MPIVELAEFLQHSKDVREAIAILLRRLTRLEEEFIRNMTPKQHAEFDRWLDRNKPKTAARMPPPEPVPRAMTKTVKPPRSQVRLARNSLKVNAKRAVRLPLSEVHKINNQGKSRQ
jgi:hypothetical protein